LRDDLELLETRPIQDTMNRTTLWAGVLVAVLSAVTVSAQDLTGDWQGTVTPATRSIRLLVHIEKANDGWRANFANIDQGTDRGLVTPATSVNVNGDDFRFTLADGRSYDGKISADGHAIVGTLHVGRDLPLTLTRATPGTAFAHATPHSIEFVTVDQGVRLEVLDWGGPSGTRVRTLVMLAGNGNTAHVFDQFVQKLTTQYHVYGITRRGFGASSAPPSGYGADRLGDDVIAVFDALKLDKPVLVGHSISGEELSSVGSRHPDRVAGLVYLDAAYGWAFYDTTRGDMWLDSLELKRQLEQLRCCDAAQDPLRVRELLRTILPRFEKDLQNQLEMPAAPPAADTFGGLTGASRAILEGEQKYITIPVPILAIYALPHDLGGQATPEARAAQAFEEKRITGQQAAFERGLPSARVVRIPNADHYIFRSNEADVLREMNSFIAGLK
jgi:pimeloyl-ACP methyl ester carboxylesterase